MNVAAERFAASAIVDLARCCGVAQATTERWQDKKLHIAAITVGCSDCCFSDFPHIASSARDVRVFILSSDFSADRTSRVPVQ